MGVRGGEGNDGADDVLAGDVGEGFGVESGSEVWDELMLLLESLPRNTSERS